MKARTFRVFIGYSNDIQDFKMPYQIYGSTDIEVIKTRYRRITNNSHGLERRYTNYG
jgi:hypothetical protein